MDLILTLLLYYKPPEKYSELNCDDPDFCYILALPTVPKICFGGSTDRDTGCIGKGLSPYQKLFSPENNPKTGPGSYHYENVTSSIYQVLNKVRSIYGTPPLGSKTSRFKYLIQGSGIAPGEYQNVQEETSLRISSKPFGTGSEIRKLVVPNIPGPADYNLQVIDMCRRPKFQDNFGKPSMVPCVETVCLVDPIHSCHLCGRFCEGEYWHKNNDFFMCQMCFQIELVTNEYYNLEELRRFKKIRNCSFMHEHNKTTAKLRILPPSRIKKKFEIENYLDSYLNCF